MSMDGKELRIVHRITAGEIYSENSIVDDNVEFTYPSYFSIDVSGREIEFANHTSGTFNPGPFNGIVIYDHLDELPDFTNLALIADGDGGGVDSSRYWFEDNSIHLNFEGLPLAGLNGLTFQVTLGEVPTGISLSESEVAKDVAGAVVGALFTSDADQTSGHSYGVDDDRFEIVDGTLKLKDGVSLSAADFPGLEIGITVTDEWSNSYQQSFILAAENTAPQGSPTADLADGRMGRAYTIREADLLDGFSDPEDNTLSVQNLSASHGTLTDNGDGTWTLRPSLLFTGEVTLNYEVSDGIAPAIGATQSFDIVFQPGSGGGTGGEPPVSVIEDTPGDDTLPGTDGDDVFQPLEGDDDVFGGEGDDSVILRGDTDGYVFVQLANGQVGVVDIDPSDGDQGSDVLDGIEFVRFGDANGTDTPLAGLIDMEQPAWTLEHDDVALVAATWQLLMGSLPSADGFEYLILSDANPPDLNDPYYAPFNAENTYLNFATNYATGNPIGSAWFEREFGELTYEEAVDKAFDLIITEAGLIAAGGDTEASKAFFLGAQGYYEQVAAERIVPGGVDLADAVKIALLSSVLYEAVRADVGPYANAVNDFAEQIQRVGTSTDLLTSLLEAA